MIAIALHHAGLEIRSLREKQRLSIREVAQSSGLSINAISKIERGEVSPTVASLHKLASALGVHITDFFIDKSDELAIFTPKDKTLRMRGEGTRIEGLGSGLPNQKIEPICMEVDPGARTSTEPVSHPGEEFVHCLAGELEYTIGQHRFVLTPGDSLIFRASQPHSWKNKGKTMARVLVIFETDHSEPAPYRFHTTEKSWRKLL